MPLGDECSILEVVLGQLSRAGFGTVDLAIGHLGQLIRAFVGDGSRWGLDVRYWEEDSPLGTVGPLIEHRDELPDDFIVMNGDILTDLPFDDLLAHHRAGTNDVTVAAYTRQVGIDFGVLELDGPCIAGFREKPQLEYVVSMGIYAMSRRALDRYTPGMPYGFDDLLLSELGTGRAPVAFPFDGLWLDIGRPEDYDRANQEFSLRRPTLIG